ncbi:CKLF-like MARVEL transmembrane domain-containing protein 6 isoform X2 [Boleophthalmus pectinirostris]|uniref:CKLF-like MARVEL transmembrane domain-containing protein 6 isoform X2 n=1 Tax=Boleophthalmus pectinirostris TaxID=150288 RepID=UPI00242CFCAD|nr:CKLF-like MARVEL transmembrane domain-containing protein 6 isoform X2 [Boleophthalmus pectinirostris]
MADTVYAPTTAPNPKDKCFLVPNDLLDLSRFFLKLAQVDFLYTSCIFVLFFIASISFSAKNSGTNLEKSAAVFGFLASLFFGLDLFFFYRTHGLPWKPAQNQENPTNEAPAPEAEKLNENGA